MLRLTLEIVPHGDEDAAHVIGTMQIVNKQKEDCQCCYKYDVSMVEMVDGASHIVTTDFQVRNFSRVDGAWALVKEALIEAFGDK